MPFIRVQNLKYDEKGGISSGSASLISTVYDRNNVHKSHQEILERFGKVVWLSDDRREGIFYNETRGLFHYSAENGTYSEVPENDGRTAGFLLREPAVHVTFGTADCFLTYLKKSGYAGIFDKMFERREDYERLLFHVFHSAMKNGSRIHADDFTEKSLLSHYASAVKTGSLRSDTGYYTMMADEKVKTTFFREYTAVMRKRHSDYGDSCFIDSTPLPNDMENTVFRALSCHGIGCSESQMRLVLITDKKYGTVIWYRLIPGNLLDINTLETVRSEVLELLGVDIREYTLDAGYCSKELIHSFFGKDGDRGNLITRMPARKGYPFRELYRKKKELMNKGKYIFRVEDHTYFGDMEKIQLFGEDVNAYIYVDRENALTGFAAYCDRHMDEYDGLKQSEKDFKLVEFGYFVLLSTYEADPSEILSEYFRRAGIESIFKTAKSYLDILPLAKWSDVTIRGSIFSDIISTMLYLEMRHEANSNGLSMTGTIGALEASICMVSRDKDMITVDYPTKKIKEIRKKLKLTNDASIKLGTYFKDHGLR